MAHMEFTVWGRVVGAARPRVTRNGTYTPKRTREYRRLVRDAFMASGGRKLSGPLDVRIDVYRELPKSRPKRVTSEPDTIKPDIDNIQKNVFDALNGVAWDDDAQVVHVDAWKHPRTRSPERVVVRISSL